jgi:hypothetical protein
MDRRQMRHERLQQLSAALNTADLERALVAYDFGSDEFLILFDRGTRPGVSRLIGSGWMLRVDRETGEPIGLQIEHLLSRTAVEHPQLMSLLDIADLTGITVEELARIRRGVMEAHRAQAMREAVAFLPVLATVAD